FLDVRDANNCLQSIAVTIQEPAAITLSGNVTDLLCNGDNSGAIDLNVGGGTPPFVYSWSNGASTQDLSGLTAGTYSVIVSDANGCSRETAFTLSEPPALTLSCTPSPISTINGNDGSILLNWEGGTPAYQITLNGEVIADTDDNTFTISDLGPGDYTVVITDQNGCQEQCVAVVNTSDCALAIVLNGTSPACFEDENGEIFAEVSGGTPPFTYQWNTGSDAEFLTGLAAGQFSLTLTDAAGCQVIESIALVAPNNLEIIFDAISPNCTNSLSGSITASVTGGTPPYSYLWSNGSSTATIDSLESGAYNLEVIDGNGCTQTGSINLEPLGSIVIEGTVTNAICEVGGNISIGINGGTSPYTVEWSTGANSLSIDSLLPGNYLVTVTDSNGCSSTESFVVLDEGQEISISANTVPISCNGDQNGAISLAIEGGTSPYIVLWSTGDTTTTIAQLGPGSYDVSVIDVNGCNATTQVLLTAPPALTLSAEISGIDCDGPGQIVPVIQGGTPPYTLLWSTGATTDVLNDITDAGEYALSITDANGCVFDTVFMVTDETTVEFNVQTQNASCSDSNDGGIEIDITDGEAPFQVRWSDGSTDEDRSDLPPGNYTVSITDNTGCFAVNSFEIISPPPITVSCSGLNATGPEVADGQLSIFIEGGTAEYRIQYESEMVSSTVGGGSGENLIGDLPPGEYSIRVTDQNGCISPDICTAIIGAPGCEGSLDEAFASVVVSPPIGCAFEFGGISFVGENPEEFEYSLDFGVNWQASSSFDSLPAGNYSTYARRLDGNGCILIGDPVSITDASSIAILGPFVDAPTSCDTGSGTIRLQPLSNSEHYMYSVDGGQSFSPNPVFTELFSGAYQVEVMDTLTGCFLDPERVYILATDNQASLTSVTVVSNSNCGLADGEVTFTGDNLGNYRIRLEGGPWQDSLRFVNLAPGTYTAELEETDNGCSFAWNLPIVVGGDTPPELDDLQVTAPESCGGQDGAIVFTYNQTAPAEFTVDGLTWSSQLAFEGLPSGTYFPGVRFVEDTSCINWLEEIVLPSGFSPQIDSVLLRQDTLCQEASGSLQVVGEEGQQFSIDNGLTWQQQGNFDNLPSGTYLLLVAGDDVDCSVEYGQFEIGQYPGTAPYLDEVTTLDATGCAGDDGAMLLSAASGSLVFALPGMEEFVDVDAFTGLTSGNYWLRIQDTLAPCRTDSIEVNIAGLDPLEMTVDTLAPPACYRGEDGLVFLSAMGGQGAYDFRWSDGVSAAERNNLAAGAYQVVLFDDRNCTDTLVISLEERADFAAVDAMVEDTAVCAQSSIMISLDTIAEGLTYTWQLPDGTTLAGTNLITRQEGLHQLSAVAEDGCSFLDTFFVDFASEEEFLVDFLIPDRALINDSTAAIDISWPQPDSVRWIFDENTISDLGSNVNQQWLSFAEPGTYDIGLEAFSGGCKGFVSRTITVFESPDSLQLYDTLQTGGEIRTVELFPNPHMGVFQVNVELGGELPVSLFIFNLDGQLVERRNFSGSSVVEASYNLPNLPTGTHTLVVQTENSLVYLRHIRVN
ncbi:T9SS type A sorting domain-containing protein, partial [Lewinella sp. W8]|uniref:T9SS type A sorting domain-containing protein n=1 Tax=Lewinella sp. W8 TaxID=2528208 RepID=UPI0012B52180